MFDYDEESKRAAEVLDKYDLSPILQSCRGVDIYDIESRIEEHSDEAASAVENLTTDELAEYFHQRYGMRIEEVPHYYMWWNDRFHSIKRQS